MQKDQNKKSSVHHKIPLDLVAVFAISFIVFLLTAPRSVTFEDSGLFILVAQYLGIAHPPGYPLYAILSHLFTLLPLGEIAFRVSLLSCFLGGLSAVLLFVILKRLTGQRALAVVGALAIMFSMTIWSQMIVAEIYPLNLFLNLLFFHLLLVNRDSASEKRVFALGLVLGFMLSNSWPLFGMAAPAYLFLIQRSWLTFKRIGILLFGTLLGLTPYLFMYFRSKQDPMISFMGPIQDFTQLINYINRSYYKSTDVSVLYTYKDALYFFGDFLKSIFWNDFFILSSPLAILGAWAFWKEKGKALFLTVAYLFVSTSVILLYFLRLEFNDLDRDIYRVFWLMPFVAYGIWMTYGALYLNNRKRMWGIAALSIVLAANIIMNMGRNDLRQDRFAELYGRTILNHVPANSILVASTDGDVGPVGYVRYGLNVNPTIEMYTGTGVLFRNRFQDPWVMGANARFQAAIDFIKKNKKVYSVKTIPIFDTKTELPIWSKFDGLVYQYSDTFEPELPISQETLDLATKALDEGVRTHLSTNWWYHRDSLSARLCNVLVLKGIEKHPAFEKIPACTQVLARHYASTNRRVEADQLFLKWLNSQAYPILREKQQHIYHFLVNRLEIINSLKGDTDRQMALLKEGLEIAGQSLIEYPLCDSLVWPLVESISGPVQMPQQVRDALKAFAECKKTKK